MVGRSSFVVRRVCGIVGLMLALSGCFSSAPRFLPQGRFYEEATSLQICSEIQSRSEDPMLSTRALVEAVMVSKKHGSSSFRYALAQKDSLNTRIDILPPEGAFTLGIFVVREGKASFVDVAQKTYRSDCQPEDLYQEFFHLEGLSPQLIIALLTGNPSIDSCQDVQVYDSGDAKTITLLEPSRHLAWNIDSDNGVLVGIDILSDDNKRVLVRAKRRESRLGLPLVAMDVFEPLEMTIELRASRLNKGAPISSNLFLLHIPRSYKRERC